MNVLIVGGGIMGLSTARALAHEGHAITVLEQGNLPSPLGASVDQHRLIRYPYGAARGYTRMVRSAYDAWARLWTDLGVALYHETGTLVLSGERDGWAAASRAVLDAEGIAHEPLAAADLAERYPMLDTSGTAQAFYCPSGGLLRAEPIVAALATYLRQCGVTLRSETKVSALDVERAEVHLAGGIALGADRLLVAAGPWTTQLLPKLAAQARPSRQVVVYLEPPEDFAAAWTRAPMLLDIGATAGFYLVPPRVAKDGTRLGLKIGDHSFGPSGDPSGAREPSAREVAAIMKTARRRLLRFDAYQIASVTTCFYDVSPEERFQFLRLGECAYAFCGSSGHGFKFGPMIGERIAAVLTGRAAYEETAPWLAGA